MRTVSNQFGFTKHHDHHTFVDQCLMLQTRDRDGGGQYKPRTLHVFRVEFKLPESLISIGQ